ncbi:THUMP domain-containing protein 2 isoform X2 [Syngnathus scovelli]|uniref:THUMP domain-containing protein 2 isoform X2 n=1 Tax=Syngnathus scovelli TaxID=161590 RepID=UPI00211077BD|nr:THUMP domain-containing protein 2 isoform X2 [Syngnathus scovelli]
MVNLGKEASLIRYFCTAGYGMEQFLIDEVTKKLAAHDIERLEGKVLFSSSAHISLVKELKSAERLFLLMKRDSPLKLSAHANPARVASVLKSTLIGDLQRWTSAEVTWRRLQGVVGDKKKEESKCEEQRKVEEENVLGEDNERDFPAMKKRRKMDCEDEDVYAGTHDQDKTRPQANRHCSDPLSFRISCKCSGSVSRHLSVQEVSKVLGTSLSGQLGWKVDLRNPQIEITVYLRDDHCLLGIPLTRLPFANRRYIKTTGLRSTVAWAMAELAQIQSGSLVLDPMCGVGTILIEAAQEHKLACFLGLDIDDRQLHKASENVAFAELRDRMHLLKASSTLSSGRYASTECERGHGGVRPAIRQEVWHQNRHGRQSATHPRRDGESSPGWWKLGSPPESSALVSPEKTPHAAGHTRSRKSGRSPGCHFNAYPG